MKLATIWAALKIISELIVKVTHILRINRILDAGKRAINSRDQRELEKEISGYSGAKTDDGKYSSLQRRKAKKRD